MDINQILQKCVPGRIPEEKHIYFFLNKSGLGDQISRLTIFNYILKHYPYVKLKVIAPDYFIDLGKHCLPEIKWFTFAQAQQLKKRFGNEIAIMADKDGLTTMRMPLVWQAYAAMCDEIPMDPENWNYVKCPLVDVSEFNLPENYVIIPIMHTAPAREMKVSILQDIINFCLTNGITPILAGKNEAAALNGTVLRGFTRLDIDAQVQKGAISLIDKTTTIQLVSIMDKAKAVIGLDNGLLHLAALCDVPIVYGFSSVEPKTRVPYRHAEYAWNVEVVTPPESLECKYCQSNMNFRYDHDFKFCWNGTYDCLNQTTSQMYIDALKRAIDNDKRK
jgi:ADP-heptose:LPS heptosyltransferase